MYYIIFGLIIFIILIILLRKKLKKFGFKIPFFEAYFENQEHQSSNLGGGRGGDAKVSGLNSTAIGGKGGGGGLGGKGGDGGHAEATNDNSFAMGGEGGEAGQLDRGGKGGRSPLEILGIENRQLPDGTFLWDRGRGGDGASHS